MGPEVPDPIPIDGTTVAACAEGELVGSCVPGPADCAEVGVCVPGTVEDVAVGVFVAAEGDGKSVGACTPTCEGKAVAVDGDVVGA